MTDKKKAGRPPTDPATHRTKLGITISPAAVQLAGQLSAKLGINRSAIIELAIRRLAEQEGR
jgi:hypothetical protein